MLKPTLRCFGKLKTVVSGGAGFIGSHLVERLLADGHEVAVLDNFSTGREENLATFIDNPRLSIHRQDAGDYQTSFDLVQDVQWVFHLGGLADLVPSITEPLRYYQANVGGTVALLEASRQTGVERFIYAASSSCYGLASQFPTPETAPIQPMYPYAFTKYMGEESVLHWNKIYGLPGVSLRLFNVFGPRSRTTGAYGAVFGVFLAQKLSGQPFTVVGDGNQTRDFTFVTDVADAFVKAAESDVQGEVMNVGSGGTYSINHLISLLGGETVHMPKRPGEPDCTFADIRKVKKLINWEPKVSFEQGVRHILENIHMWDDAPVWNVESISKSTADWFKYL
jgi:UDP-glucose 4-epimerase